MNAEIAGHQFQFKLSAHGPHGKLPPEIQAELMAAPGTADHRVESYNLRLILTKELRNKIRYFENDRVVRMATETISASDSLSATDTNQDATAGTAGSGAVRGVFWRGGPALRRLED